MINALLYTVGLGRKRAKAQRREGDTARDGGDWAGAATAYRAYLYARPRAWPIWVQLGHAYKESGNLVAAEIAYRTAAEGAPQDADAQLQFGRILRLQGRLEEARAALSRSAALQPIGDAANELASLQKLIEAQLIGSIYRDAGDKARDAQQWLAASHRYQNHLKIYPTDAAIWLQFGNVLKQAGNLPEAEASYRRAIDLDATSADSFLQLGHVLKLVGEREAAIEAYRKSEALDKSGSASLELAAAGVRGSAVERAAAESLHPQKATSAPTTTMQWGILLNAQEARDAQDWHRAAGLYRTYLATATDAGSIWAELSFVLSRDGRYHEALNALKAATGLLPGDMQFFREQAILLWKLGRLEEAAFMKMQSMLQVGRRDSYQMQGLNDNLRSDAIY